MITGWVSNGFQGLWMKHVSCVIVIDVHSSILTKDSLALQRFLNILVFYTLDDHNKYMMCFFFLFTIQRNILFLFHLILPVNIVNFISVISTNSSQRIISNTCCGGQTFLPHCVGHLSSGY